MALTNQPYFPLYVKDWMTSTNLKYCSMEAHGLLINLMCLMHKSELYGQIILRDKFRTQFEESSAESAHSYFARQISVLLPWDFGAVTTYLKELLDENVLHISEHSLGIVLFSERMVADGNLSKQRSSAGKRGGNKSKPLSKTQAKGEAKQKQITEYEYENENAIESENETGNEIKKSKAPESKLSQGERYIVENVMTTLVELSGRPLQIFSKSAIRFILARSKAGATLEELIEVVQLKCMEWKNDDKMFRYLSPDTLFNATKFGKYREQVEEAKLNPMKIKKAIAPEMISQEEAVEDMMTKFKAK